MDNRTKKPGIGVVVGRFQVPDLHAGHRDLIDRANAHQKLLIAVGVAPGLLTQRDPLDFPTRQQMLLAAYPNATVIALADEPTDAGWTRTLDGLVRLHYPLGEVVLYGGRDSFVDTYQGTFTTRLIDETPAASGTREREQVRDRALGDRAFRQGVIYAANNRWPQTNLTVDVALVRRTQDAATGTDVQDGWEVLLGWKRGRPEHWRFPGGFVDPADDGTEAAARRELREETGLGVEGALRFLGNYRVRDWREAPDVLFFTNFYLGQYNFGAPHPADDLDALAWHNLRDLPRLAFADDHARLAQVLIKHLEDEFTGENQ